MDETLRLFVGLALPPAHQALVDGLRPGLAARVRTRATWTRPGNAHVTLKFLGNVGRERREAVTAALAGVRFAPFDLTLGSGGFFPGPARPRVLWVGITAGAQACRELAAAVDTALVPLGFAAETRPFAAHMTLGRLKEPGGGIDAAGLLGLLAATAWPPVVVTGFTLFASLPGPDGPRYLPQARFGATGP